MGTIEGLASMFVDFLQQATWAERVNILYALLSLLPEMSSDLRSRLQAKLLYLLNQDQPPSLQVNPSTVPHILTYFQNQPQFPSANLLLSLGQDSEAVCDAGTAAAPGLHPGGLRCGFGDPSLLPLLTSQLSVS